METKPVDLELLTALNELVANLSKPDYEFVVSANYYDHQAPQRMGERWYIAQIWLTRDSAESVALTDEGLVCEVHLNRHDYSQVSRILMPYDQIWNVQRLRGPSDFEPHWYCRGDKLNFKRPSDVE